MGREPILAIETHPEPELNVPGLGRVRVQHRSLFFHRDLAWRRVRPLAADYRAFGNAAIADSLAPTHPEAVIDALPERARHRLMLAVVRAHGEERAWRRLTGSHLSPDERFFAVMVWAAERDEAQHRRVLAALREAQGRELGDLAAETARVADYSASRVDRSLLAAFEATSSWTKMFKTLDFHRTAARSASPTAWTTRPGTGSAGPTSSDASWGQAPVATSLRSSTTQTW